MEQIEIVSLADLKPWPGNPRRGNIEAIMESLREHGQYKPVLVQKSSGRMIAGHGLREGMQRLGWREAKILRLDVDDDAAQRILLVDNRLSDRGAYDDDALREMLTGLGDFAGTGYTAADVEAMLDAAVRGDDELLASALAGEDDIFILDSLPSTGAAWAELPQQEAARAERQAAQVPHAVAGTREIMLVYVEGEHTEMMRMLDGLRRAWGGELRYPQIVQRLVRNAAAEAGLL